MQLTAPHAAPKKIGMATMNRKALTQPHPKTKTITITCNMLAKRPASILTT